MTDCCWKVVLGKAEVVIKNHHHMDRHGAGQGTAEDRKSDDWHSATLTPAGEVMLITELNALMEMAEDREYEKELATTRRVREEYTFEITCIHGVDKDGESHKDD